MTHTPLQSPSPLLREIRAHFIDAGGSAQAFDFAVNDYAAKRAASDAKPADGAA